MLPHADGKGFPKLLSYRNREYVAQFFVGYVVAHFGIVGDEGDPYVALFVQSI